MISTELGILTQKHLHLILGDPGADPEAGGQTTTEGGGGKGEEGKTALSPRPLPLRRLFSSRPSFPSAPRSVPGSPRMTSPWWSGPFSGGETGVGGSTTTEGRGAGTKERERKQIFSLPPPSPPSFLLSPPFPVRPTVCPLSLPGCLHLGDQVRSLGLQPLHVCLLPLVATLEFFQPRVSATNVSLWFHIQWNHLVNAVTLLLRPTCPTLTPRHAIIWKSRQWRHYVNTTNGQYLKFPLKFTTIRPLRRRNLSATRRKRGPYDKEIYKFDSKDQVAHMATAEASIEFLG